MRTRPVNITWTPATLEERGVAAHSPVPGTDHYAAYLVDVISDEPGPTAPWT